MFTKRQIVQLALEEIGLGVYIFDMTPEQLESARFRLDNIAAQWDATGVRHGYRMGFGLDDDSGLPDTAVNAYALWLALSIAPTYGKTASMETKANAAAAKNALLITNYDIPQVQRPTTMPIGTGNRRYLRERQYFRETDVLTTGNDGELEII